MSHVNALQPKTIKNLPVVKQFATEADHTLWGTRRSQKEGFREGLLQAFVLRLDDLGEG